MRAKRIFAGLGLALAGLAAAVAIGLLANSISGDSVGLSAESLSPGEALAPPAAERSKAPRERRAERLERERPRSAPTQTTRPPAQTPPPVTDDNGGSGGVVEPGDDKGGLDNSGSGSSGSGSSGGSGSDDSGSGGHGSDD